MKTFYFVYAYLDPMMNCNIILDDCTFKNLPFYIGYGSNNRHLDHLKNAITGTEKTNLFKFNKIKKILDTGNIPIIIKIQENLSIEDAKSLEKKLIKEIGTRSKIQDHPIGPLTNLKGGGDGGELSNETKAKVSKNVTIAMQDPVIRQKISDTHKGKPKPKSGKHLAELNRSPEKRKRTSERMMGHSFNEEQLQRISDKVSAHVKNTIWINDGIINKRVLSSIQIPEGWIKGRLMSKETKDKIFPKNTIWINNGIVTKKMTNIDQIPEGWKKGRSLLNK